VGTVEILNDTGSDTYIAGLLRYLGFYIPVVPHDTQKNETVSVLSD
jgi:hypothetical protein